MGVYSLSGFHASSGVCLASQLAYLASAGLEPPFVSRSLPGSDDPRAKIQHVRGSFSFVLDKMQVNQPLLGSLHALRLQYIHVFALESLLDWLESAGKTGFVS